MTRTAKQRSNMIQVRTPNVPGYSHSVDAIKYDDAMKRAVLQVLPRRAPGLTQTEMFAAITTKVLAGMFPGYVGGLRTAIEQTAKRAPDVYLHNMRQAGSEQMVSLREWLAVELHSRQLNPKWIQEMQKSGYAGAREISKEIEHLYGFQKTTPEHLSPQTWQSVLDVFVKDKYHLGLRRFFQEQNPHARQTVLARLLEVGRQQIQRFSAGDRKMLLSEYARSVTRDGAACNAQVCGNAVLRQHVAHELRRSGSGSRASTMEAAFRRTLTKLASEVVVKKATAPPARVLEWRTLAKRTISWTKQWPVAWNLMAVPRWAWIGCIFGYVAAAGLLIGRRQTFAIGAINLLGPSRSRVDNADDRGAANG